MMQPSCPGLSLMMRAGRMVMILRQSMEKSKLVESEEDETGEEQSQEHAYDLL
jgi:hypothetical protein